MALPQVAGGHRTLQVFHARRQDVQRGRRVRALAPAQAPEIHVPELEEVRRVRSGIHVLVPSPVPGSGAGGRRPRAALLRRHRTSGRRAVPRAVRCRLRGRIVQGGSHEEQRVRGVHTMRRRDARATDAGGVRRRAAPGR